MLYITRRPGERIVIGDEVFVTVVDVSGTSVRLGFAAPEDVPISREEALRVSKEDACAEASAQRPPSAPAQTSGLSAATEVSQDPPG